MSFYSHLFFFFFLFTSVAAQQFVSTNNNQQPLFPVNNPSFPTSFPLLSVNQQLFPSSPPSIPSSPSFPEPLVPDNSQLLGPPVNPQLFLPSSPSYPPIAPSLPVNQPFKTIQYSTSVTQNTILPSMDTSSFAPVNINIDPEALMTVPDIVTHWGYPVEVHNVVTQDGYILQLHRIPRGKNSPKNSTDPRPVVFLQHGLLCTSSIWLLNLPHQSAGFVFADAGFDVWLGNMRGNAYSKLHNTYPNTDSRFWKFSWEEMAKYDIPAMIDYVLNTTSQPHLYYVGHSQGTLTMFAQLSKQPTFAKKIRKFFALAPVARMSHVKGMFDYLGKIYEQFTLFYNLFGDNEFLANNIITRLMTDIVCDASKATNNDICGNFIFSVSGPNSNQLNSSRIGIFLAHNPAGTSVKNILHFSQIVKKGRMSSFDYGKQENTKIYGTSFAPEYYLNRIEVPTYFFYSDYDWLANSQDIEGYLLKVLPKTTVKFVKKLHKFNHNDFLWGLRARKEIYDPIVNFIRLDSRRMNIQHELKKYFMSGQTTVDDKTRSAIVKHLNKTLEFE